MTTIEIVLASLALVLAVAVPVASAIALLKVARINETAAAKRFNAERQWLVADEFRREVASLISTINEQAGLMLTLQEYGPKILTLDGPAKFDAKMQRIDELALDATRIGQSIHLLVERDRDDDKALLTAIIELIKMVSRSHNSEFPKQPIFSELGESLDIGIAAIKVSELADTVLKRLQKAV